MISSSWAWCVLIRQSEEANIVGGPKDVVRDGDTLHHSLSLPAAIRVNGFTPSCSYLRILHPLLCKAAPASHSAGSSVSRFPLRPKYVSAVSAPSSAGRLVSWFPVRPNPVSAVSAPSSAAGS